MTAGLLGTPFTAGPVRLRNRVVSPPMERNYGTPDGRVTRRYLDYLRARAAGGAALVFTEATYVRPDGRGRVRQLGADRDDIVPGLRELAGAVHAEGAAIGVELNHAGRVADPAISGFQPVAPSPVPFRAQMPRELATDEIAGIVRAFGAAAVRCAAAGVDVVEIHAAHGYLIHQFLSPRTNRRTDEYRDPVRLLNEVLAAVRAAATEQAVFLRLSAFEGVPGGLDAEATLALAERIDLAAVDVLDISAGCYEAGEWMVQPGETARGVLAPHAARFRALGKAICVAGRIPTGEAAEEILRSGAADLVSVGRALHADPAWPRTVLAGRAPRPCIACNQGCIDQLHTQQPIWCVVNPDTSHEGRPSFPARPRRVLVIGGGPAGLEAATRAARRGHTVTLLERQPVLGGQFRLIPGHPEFARLLDFYRAELTRLAVEVCLSTAATPGEVAARSPDAVIVATGGVGHRPAVPGADLSHVVDIRDWLADPAAMPAATVWGADRAGIAVAGAVAATGADVLLIGSQSEPAPEAGPREKVLAVERLRDNPRVRIRLCSTVEAIGLDRLLIGAGGRRQWIRAPGPVLVSGGVVPAPVDAGAGPWRTYLVGDAGTGTSAADAIHQAAAAVDALG